METMTMSDLAGAAREETSSAAPAPRALEPHRSRINDWTYEVLPAEVRALREGPHWHWRVTQEAVIEADGVPCRGRAELEVDGPSGRLTSVRHSFEAATGVCIDIRALGMPDLDTALLAVMHRTARAILDAHGLARETDPVQIYKLAGVLDHLCREAMRPRR